MANVLSLTILTSDLVDALVLLELKFAIEPVVKLSARGTLIILPLVERVTIDKTPVDVLALSMLIAGASPFWSNNEA